MTHIIDGIVPLVASRRQTIPHEELLAEFEADDSPSRRIWFSTVAARTLAIAVLKYRLDRGLSQRALGEQLGMSQPQVARLEVGEHTPTIDTLCRLADTLGLDIDIRIGPREDGRREIPKSLAKGVAYASDQVIVAVRERPARR